MMVNALVMAYWRAFCPRLVPFRVNRINKIVVDASVFLGREDNYSVYNLTTLGAETFANFAQIRECLRREKLYIDRFAKVYAREMFQFFLFSLQTCWLLMR